MAIISHSTWQNLPTFTLENDALRAVMLAELGGKIASRFDKVCQLRMEWSPEALPYLGIWVDEGEYNRVPVVVVAIEPSNGYHDRLNHAAVNGSAPVLAPGKSLHWTLKVTLPHGKPAHNT